MRVRDPFARDMKLTTLVHLPSRLRLKCPMPTLLPCAFTACTGTNSLSPLQFFPIALQPLVGQGLFIVEASRWHTDTPHSVVLLWDEWSDRRRDLYLTTHKTHNRQKSMSRRDSNPQSKKWTAADPRHLNSTIHKSSWYFSSNNTFTNTSLSE
jgi:hypothetical protein